MPRRDRRTWIGDNAGAKAGPGWLGACAAVLAGVLMVALPNAASAYDCSQTLPENEWVSCDAENAPTFRPWSASVAGGGYIWHWGGGHRDYSGNAVVLYDTSDDSWTQATTNETWHESGFDSALGDWTEAEYGEGCYTEAEQDTIQDAFNSGETQRDEETLRGRPFVRHVYNERMYWPDRGVFCTAVSGFWCYDPSKGDQGGTDNDCTYDDADNEAWTKYTDSNVQEPPGQRFESTAFSYDPELDGGALITFGGAEGHKVKKSTDGSNWSFVSDGEGGDFTVGGSGGWGSTATAYASEQGVHIVGKSVDQGPDKDAYYRVDLVEKSQTEIASPLVAAGVSSGNVAGLSYDPGAGVVLAWGSFDGERAVWQYDMQQDAWSPLHLAGSMPTSSTSGAEFDYLNYDETTGRHYLLWTEGGGDPVQVHAFRLGGAHELCANDTDDDGDGQVDCDDSDCAPHIRCSSGDAGVADAGAGDAGLADGGPGMDDAGPVDPRDAGSGNGQDAAAVSPDASGEASMGSSDGCGCVASGPRSDGGPISGALLVGLATALVAARRRRRV